MLFECRLQVALVQMLPWTVVLAAFCTGVALVALVALVAHSKDMLR